MELGFIPFLGLWSCWTWWPWAWPLCWWDGGLDKDEDPPGLACWWWWWSMAFVVVVLAFLTADLLFFFFRFCDFPPATTDPGLVLVEDLWTSWMEEARVNLSSPSPFGPSISLMVNSMRTKKMDFFFNLWLTSFDFCSSFRRLLAAKISKLLSLCKICNLYPAALL